MNSENTTVSIEHLFDDMESEQSPDTSIERVDTSTEIIPCGDTSTSRTLGPTGQQMAEDMYMSLISTPARTETSLTMYPSSNQLALTSSYLNPQNTSSSLTSHKPKHGKGRRQHRRSSASTESHVENVKHRYKKLEICFAVLCLLNVIMFVFYILTNPKYGLISDNREDDFFETEGGEPRTFKLCTKCQPLEAKAGFDLLHDIKSSTYPDFCCFRRVDQLLQLIDGYAEIYVDQEVGKVRNEVSFNITTGIKTGSPAPRRQTAMAHMYYKDTGGVKSNDLIPLRWETQGVDILLVGSMKVVGQKHLQVLQTGYYYIYSHLQLKGNVEAVHQVMKNFDFDTKKKLLYQKSRKTDQASELQGLFRLKKEDLITVVATNNAIESGERKNYFGVFLVGQII